MKTTLEFADLKFSEEKEKIKVDFMKNYYFYLEKKELEKIGNTKTEQNKLIIDASEKKVNNKFYPLLNKAFLELKHKIRNKDTIYIHKNLGLPLIGTNEFGLVDRGSNIIEIKPLTGCNLSCIFCSVFEGKNDKKDIVIEEEYLVEEFEKLAKIKKHPIEANIGPQGEPMLYPKFLELVRDLKKIPNVEVISVNTNGLFLNKKNIDELADAGLTRINLSLHTTDKKLADKLADAPYNVEQVLKMIKYCEGKIDVLLAPVLIPGYNEKEIDKIIQLSKTIKNKKYPSIGIQNFLNYKGGRNLTKQISWDEFYEFLKQKEKQHDIKLIVNENIFNIQKDKTLEKPFKKGHIITVEIITEGRNKNEVLGRSKNRAITILNCKQKKGTIKVKLLRDKHNIYTAIPI
ncbi:radical SAM protein [Candidatus Woesearchaeota archaeon]|nr:radical SAM protein [Candidatus Woesearchaeota archaeon]